MSRFYDRRVIVAGSAAAAVIVLSTGSLGFWQLHRADERAAAQSARDAAAAAPAREIHTPAEALAAAAVGARIRVRGVFDASHTVFLDNRTRAGVAGFHVLTPLRLIDSDRHVLVLRGWIAGDRLDRSRLPEVTTPRAMITIEGLALADLDQPIMLARDEPPTARDALWQHIDLDKFKRWARLDLSPIFLRQTVEPDYTDALARDWNQPGVSVDRHHGYAFQWFAMATAAIVGWLFLVLRGGRVVAGEAP